MLSSFNLPDFFDHFRRCTAVVGKTWPFIKKNKLWEGYLENRWVVIVTIVTSLFFSYFLIDDIYTFIRDSLASISDGLSFAGHTDVETVDHIKSESRGQAISSGTKYLWLILLEVVIFHFSIKAVNKLRGLNHKPGFNDFLRAEKRMIRLMFIIFIKTWILHLLINTSLHIAGLGFATKALMILVHGYFIGYAFFDNYNEQFDKSNIESQYIIREHVGAAMALGVVVGILLYIPLLGPVLAPIFGGIAAAIYGNKYQMELTPIILPERWEKKKNKKEAA